MHTFRSKPGPRSLSVLAIAVSLAACGNPPKDRRKSLEEPRHPEQLTQDGTATPPAAAASSPRVDGAADRPTKQAVDAASVADGTTPEALADAPPASRSTKATTTDAQAADAQAADAQAADAQAADAQAADAQAADAQAADAQAADAQAADAQAADAQAADAQAENPQAADAAPADGKNADATSAIAPASGADARRLPAPAIEVSDSTSSTSEPTSAPDESLDGPSPFLAEGATNATPVADATTSSRPTGETDDRHTSPSTPQRPIDYAGTFWLGDGYDALSGARRASCLDDEKVEFRSYPLNQSDDTLELVLNREELSRKLNIEMNAEASGAWNAITATPSIKSSILRETEITNTSVVAIARFRFLKNRISLYQSIAPLHPDRLADLAADKELFREECGDKFTRSMRVGAELILVITAQQLKSTQHSATQVTAALKVGFGAAFSINQTTTLTRDQKQILDNFYVSTRCYTNGASPLPCADNGLNITGVSFGDTAILDRINGAKRSLAAEIAAGNNLVVLDEELESYPLPAASRGRPPEQVFVDYASQLRNIQAWLRLESRIQLICDSLPDVESACYEARLTLADAIDACADYRLWPRNECRAPHDGDLAFLKAQSDAGSLTLYEHGSRRGRSATLSFHDVFDRDSPLKPGVLYDLGDQRFGWFVDIASSADAFLRNGWQVVVYEHPDGTGREWIVEPGMQGYVNAAGGFNDKASAFRLVRVGH